MKNDDQTTPNEQNKPPPNDPETILALCHDLAEALSAPDYGSSVLRRQAQLLDNLLYTTMDRYVQRDIDQGCASDDWVELVLRIQKQCVETLKAMEAVEYMKALSARASRSLPPPPQTGERNEGSLK